MSDSVKHPGHYTAYPVEVIDMIRAVLGDEGFKAYCLGNEIKYRMRAGFKGDNAAEDIAKAMQYKEFREGVKDPPLTTDELWDRMVYDLAKEVEK